MVKMIGTIQVLLAFVAICISVGQGKSPSQIVGGSPAKIGEFPHQVSIRTKSRHLCGGAIIGSRHILTAAHCFVEGSSRMPYANLFAVVAGSNDREYFQSSHEYAVTSYAVSAGYDSSDSHKEDIAILTLKEPITFSETVKPIDLPTSDIEVGAEVTATGWGQQYFVHGLSLPLPRELLKVDMKVVDRETCAKSLGQKISTLQLCAFRGKGFGTCVGDSGGPLVSKNTIVGITSWGKPCGTGSPDVFTRVFKYLKWINKVVNGTQS